MSEVPEVRNEVAEYPELERIVKAWESSGGEIGYDSEPGVKTTFFFTLPKVG